MLETRKLWIENVFGPTKKRKILWAIVNEVEGGKVVNSQPHHHHSPLPSSKILQTTTPT